MTNATVFYELSQRGAARAVVSFSGGNDEGGADSIELFDADGEQIASLETWGDDLGDALAAPVEAEYGGFGGDFSVSGEVVWDVATRRVTMSGEQSEMVPFESAW